ERERPAGIPGERARGGPAGDVVGDCRHGVPAAPGAVFFPRVLYAGGMSEGPRWHWQAWQPGERAEDAARVWLASQLGCDAARVGRSRDARGRPRLRADHGGDVGWSHSGGGLLIAHGPRMVLGVDLEREHERPRAL